MIIVFVQINLKEYYVKYIILFWLGFTNKFAEEMICWVLTYN